MSKPDRLIRSHPDKSMTTKNKRPLRNNGASFIRLMARLGNRVYSREKTGIVMTNPKGFRNRSFTLDEGGQVMVYSNPDQIILQLRREIPTETNVLQPSFKVAISLTPSEALALASELLQAASSQLEKKETKPGELPDSGS